MTTSPGGDSSGDTTDPVAEIVAAWKARGGDGAGPTLDELCDANPHHAEEIRSRVALLEELGRHLGREPRAAPARLPPLRTDRYAGFRTAGAGGMGIVYWAIDSDLNREVAFKVVRPAGGPEATTAPPAPMDLVPPARGTPASAAFATLKARFLQEAWVTAGLSHPGIVPVYELGETPQGVPFYTMRFVRGNRTLAQAIDAVQGAPWEERLSLLEPFLKVCDTLSYAHAQGIVHRDVKPENVALGEFGEVVVLDWGLAKIGDADEVGGGAWLNRVREFRETADLRTLASALGTPGYMSPEAALGRVAEVDARSDVYSLGAMLYRILTGRLPFEFATFVELVRKLLEGTPTEPSGIDAGVPAELSRLCLRALSKNRDARPASADAFAAEIRAWQTRRTVDREADGLLHDAQAALDSADGLTGAAAAAEIDRAAAIVSRAVGLRPDDAAHTLAGEIGRRREATAAGRERAARQRTLRRVGTAVLAASAVAAALVALLLESARQDTEAARELATKERDAKAAALRAELASSRRARAFALAEASAEPLATSPQLSLLLARESVRVEPTSNGVSRLHDALAACRERVRFVSDRPEELVARVRCVGYVGDGSRVAGADARGGVYVWDAEGRLLAKREAPTTLVVGFAVSADGSRFATGGSRAANVWSAAGDAVTVLPGHDGGVACVRLDRTGRRVLTVDAHRARFWDDSRGLLATVGEDANPPAVGDVAPDGHAFATGATDGTLALFDDAGRGVAVVRAAGAKLNLVRYAPGGDALVTAGSDGRIAIWTAAGAPLASFDVPTGPTPRSYDCRAGFSPDGKRVLAWGADGALQLRDRAGTELLRIPGDGRQRKFRWTYPLLATFSPDGSRIAATSLSGDVRIWTSGGRSLGTLRGNSNQAAVLEFSRDGERVLTTSPNDGSLAWDVDGAEDRRWPSDGAEAVPATALSRDAARLYCALKDGKRRFTDLSAGTLVTLPSHGPGSAFNARAVPSRDGRRVVTAWADEPPTVETLAGGEPVVLRGHEGAVTHAAFSPDGRLVATASDDRTARIWRADGEPVAVLSGHVAAVSRVVFSDDGRLVATGARDGEVRVFDLAGTCLAHWSDLDVEVMGLAFSPDGRAVAACSFRTNSVCVFDVGGALRWARRRVDVRMGGQLADLEWSPDGSHLLAMIHGGGVHVWRADGTPRAVLRASEGGLLRATFSHDGTLVAAATDGPAALLFDVDGNRIATVRTESANVQDVAFTPDGRFLVTAALDGSASRWFIGEEDLVRRADERVTRTYTRNEGERYESLLGDGNRRRVRALRHVEEAVLSHPLLADAVAGLAARADLDADDRREAVEIARGRRDDWGRLTSAAWDVVVDPAALPVQVADAVRWSEVAARLAPDNESSLSTLGASLFRAGRSDDALPVLLRADLVARTGGGKGFVDASVFLALLLARRGDVAEAERRLAEALAMARDARTPTSTKRLLEEAARTIEEARARR